MSAESIAKLRQIWGKLTFAQVERVVAREPEDVGSITIYKAGNHVDYYVESKRTKDIPPQDLERARVYWRHYYGFTKDGVYFNKEAYHGIDCTVDMTLDWSTYGNHQSKEWDKPVVGSWICGEVVETPKGKRFEKWFDFGPEFKFLYDIVMHGTDLTEEELRPKLRTHDFADTYWAIARLVMFDNVQAFVSAEFMHTQQGSSQLVHEISYRLGQPKWWERFKELAFEQGCTAYRHPAEGGWCKACEAEGRSNEMLGITDFIDDYFMEG